MGRAGCCGPHCRESLNKAPSLQDNSTTSKPRRPRSRCWVAVQMASGCKWRKRRAPGHGRLPQAATRHSVSCKLQIQIHQGWLLRRQRLIRSSQAVLKVLLAREPKWEQRGQAAFPDSVPASSQQPLLGGSQHWDQRPVPAEPTTAQGAVIPYWSQEAVAAAFCSLYPPHYFENFCFPIVEDLVNQPPFTCFTQWHCRGERGHRGQHLAHLPGRTSLPPPLSSSWRPSKFKDQSCPSQTMSISQSQARTQPELRQVLHNALHIEWEPRRRVAIVAGDKRRAPFGDWEAMAVVASSHIDDPRWQGLVLNDIHHSCPLRGPRSLLG